MLSLRAAEVITTWPSLGPPPRRVRFRRTTFLIGIGFPAACLVFAFLTWRGEQEELAQLKQIVDTGVETTARIVARGVNRSTRHPQYLVDCAYQVNGRRYVQQFDSRELYDRAPSERSVVLSYAVDDPGRARLGTLAALGRQHQHDLSMRWAPPGVFLAMGSVFASIYWRRMSTLLRFAREGAVRWGTVTSISVVKNSSFVTVTVDDAQGRTIGTGRAGYDFEQFQPIGSQAAVLSDPNDPSRVRLAEEISDRIQIDPPSTP